MGKYFKQSMYYFLFFSLAIFSSSQKLKAQQLELFTPQCRPLFIISLDGAVHQKGLNKKIRDFAYALHDGLGQTYGDHPYSYHLHKVREVLKRFGFGPKDSVLGLLLGSAAYLHDVMEDAGVSYDLVRFLFGQDLADVVWGVSNVPRQEGLSQKERKRLTLMKTASDYRSKVLKLADRIANMEESLMNFKHGKTTKIKKYLEEWDMFETYLYNPQEAQLWPMWDHLRSLVAEAQSIVI